MYNIKKMPIFTDSSRLQPREVMLISAVQTSRPPSFLQAEIRVCWCELFLAIEKVLFSDQWLEHPEYKEWVRRDTDKYKTYCFVCKKSVKLGKWYYSHSKHTTEEKNTPIFWRQGDPLGNLKF